MALPRYLRDEEIDNLVNESECEDGIDYSSGSDENYEPLVNEIHSSDSSIDENISDDDAAESTNGDYVDVDPMFVSKDGKTWNRTPVQHAVGRVRVEQVIKLSPGD